MLPTARGLRGRLVPGVRACRVPDRIRELEEVPEAEGPGVLVLVSEGLEDDGRLETVLRTRLDLARRPGDRVEGEGVGGDYPAPPISA